MEANSALGIQHKIQLQKYEFIYKGCVSFLKVLVTRVKTTESTNRLCQLKCYHS